MIIKQRDITQVVKGKVISIGTIYQEENHIVVEVEGYRFKTRYRTEEDNICKYYDIVHSINRNDNPVLHLVDSSRTIRAVIYPDMTITSCELAWVDRSHTIKDLYKLYKRKRMVLI